MCQAFRLLGDLATWLGPVGLTAALATALLHVVLCALWAWRVPTSRSWAYGRALPWLAFWWLCLALHGADLLPFRSEILHVSMTPVELAGQVGRAVGPPERGRRRTALALLLVSTAAVWLAGMTAAGAYMERTRALPDGTPVHDGSEYALLFVAVQVLAAGYLLVGDLVRRAYLRRAGRESR